jgi:hypothetical protein
MRTKLTLVALALSMSIVSSASLASTEVAVGGQACTGQNLTNAFGAINTSNAVETLECPAIMDHLLTPSRVFATVFDRNRTSDVVCTFFGKDAAGNITFTSTRNTTGTSASTIALVSTIPPASDLDFSIECTVPALDPGGPSGGASGISTMAVRTN